jgi:hypothetical protein
MTLNTLPQPSKDQILELSAIIAHCPLAKNFLHLGCSDGLICQIASSFMQFDLILGLDNAPLKIAYSLFRKDHPKTNMPMVHFYFHHFGYPFWELPSHTLAFLSASSVAAPLQHQLCHWIENMPHIESIASSTVLPLHAKTWYVKTVEELDYTSFYIYDRLV